MWPPRANGLGVILCQSRRVPNRGSGCVVSAWARFLCRQGLYPLQIICEYRTSIRHVSVCITRYHKQTDTNLDDSWNWVRARIIKVVSQSIRLRYCLKRYLITIHADTIRYNWDTIMIPNCTGYYICQFSEHDTDKDTV